ncbi:hypothetical protein [Bacteroides intestinalis]|jgi:hypothetical protein|uniref:hypothetical protein n=1 Tax=Bacteroides intestinalis TaxID=329854 RepID=UPI00189C7DC3|nr:hypothetical protein [Bacteroides intestinalis]
MKLRGMIQILIPFATTIVLWGVFGILGFVLKWLGDDTKISTLKKIGRFLKVNIFRLEDGCGDLIPSSITFWIINFIAIIFLEWLFTGYADEDGLK